MSNTRFLLPGLAWLAVAVLGTSSLQAHAETHQPSAADGIDSACAGIPAALRGGSLLHDRLILDVRPVSRRVGKPMWRRLQGVEIFIAAERCDSAPWLRRIIRCQTARGLGATNPLNVPGAKLSLREAGHAFVLRVTADRVGPAREVLKRAQQLLLRGPNKPH